ncbi:MAG: cupin domain-containing protein [Pseudomonadota bacterium]
MSSTDSAHGVNVLEAARFASDGRVNEKLIAIESMVVRMNCYEPGQVTPMHMHPDEDEIVYVVEGRGTVTFQDADDCPVAAGDLVRLPANQFHQIEANAGERMVLIYFMKPDYTSVRPDTPATQAAEVSLPGERV